MSQSGNPDPNPAGLHRPGADPDGTTAAATITDGAVVLGDGGTRAIKGSANLSENAGGQLLTSLGTAGAPAVTNSAQTNKGIYWASGYMHLAAGGAKAVSLRSTNLDHFVHCTPGTDAGSDSGNSALRWGTTFTGGVAVEYVSSAAATYAADGADCVIVMTAATAQINLPAATTRGILYIVQFTGATGRTLNPDGTDTVDVGAPAQNKHYLVIPDGVSNWKCILLD